MLSSIDSSEKQGWQVVVPPDASETTACVDDERPNFFVEQKPSGANLGKRASVTMRPGTVEAVPHKLSKVEKRPPLRFHLIGGADAIGAEARNVLASLDDPLLEVIDGPPRPTVSGIGDASPEIAGVVLEGIEGDSFEEIHKLDQSSPRPVVLALVAGRSTALMRRALTRC
jgi:hypothetical protein